ncbi:helix-turn-helix transcriptional regulator [Prosthecochloris sp. GSB1]|uniref:helix-turn-helix transcriptional regulator n=1 Tax=Prosthecochloris sp. GSB1 TaxID=281093 RepID=UPI0012377D93|nr:hypothetical protein [Prosthecochloris sp. GSB1]
MERCPVSGAPVTSRPQWVYHNSKEEYSTCIRRIGNNILYLSVTAERPVILDHFEGDLVAEVVRDSGLEGKPFSIIWNLDMVAGLSHSYKKGVGSFLYLHPQPSLRCVVFHYIRPEFIHTAECIRSIAPSTMALLFASGYDDAMKSALACMKDGAPETGESEYPRLRNEFLGAATRIGWLNMLHEHILLPPPGHELFPFFSGMALLQKDLAEQQEIHKAEKDRLLVQYGKETENMNTQLSFCEKAMKQLLLDSERDKTALSHILSDRKQESMQSSSAYSGDRSIALKQLCHGIHNLDIDRQRKKEMLKICNLLLETERNEQKIDLPLTTTDSDFLTHLQEKHPNLNRRELKICLLIKLSYSNEDIAEKSGISRRGMESIRYRMHKKIGLRKNQSLKNYLTQLSTSAF